MGIVLKNAVKRYGAGSKGGYTALHQVTLEIQKGEMLAICGPSGAGKSTLLHMIGLLDTLTEGSLELDGIHIGEAGNSKMARIRNEKIGFVLQDFGLIEEESVLFNVSVPLLLGKMPFRSIRKAAMQKLEKMGVQHLAEKQVALLSGGEKQRVAIARALVNHPEYILADEPAGALDRANAENVMQILHQLHEEGKTVVMVTHDEKAASECGRKIVLVDGRIVE